MTSIEIIEISKGKFDKFVSVSNL